MVRLISVFILGLILSFNLFAKGNWNRIVIPGAKCGDGSAYHVYFLERAASKLLVTFVSGGACWSKSTCFGPNLRTWAHPVYKDPKLPIFARNNYDFQDHSVLHLPYCTGDVFTGKHMAVYNGKEMFHYGAINVQKTLEYLTKKNFIHFSEIDDLFLYGSSAGGIGALVHSKAIEKFVKRNAKKTIIADSPGLHFGRDFWDKFTPKQIHDFKSSFESIEFMAPLNDGMVAPYLGQTCEHLKRWNIGVLMGSKDIVMSKIFGNIGSNDHEDLVYSVEGIAEIFRGQTNCSVWLKRSMIHTFLLGLLDSHKLKVKGVSTLKFINEVYAGDSQKNIIEEKVD